MKNILVVVLLFLFVSIKGQESNKIQISDVGFAFGYYNPSLDYWRNESEFREANFYGAVEINLSANIRLINHLTFKPGIGIWQTSTEENLQGYGNTTWSLTGYPFMLDLTYSAEILKLWFLTPYITAGGDFIMIYQKYRFERKPNPEPVNGSTLTFKSAAGLSGRLSKHVAIDMEFGYRWGSYEQEFIKYIKDPDGNLVPQNVTETISLSGIRPMVTLRYFLQ